VQYGAVEKIGWVLMRDGRLLVARNHGRSRFYLPGGRRETGETHAETLVREAMEELSVTIDPSTMQHVVTVTAQRDGGTGLVTMACYTAEHRGPLTATNEIAELAWITSADTDRVTAAEHGLIEHLVAHGRLPHLPSDVG
jgi:8-oxo-dGTP diphosphatase